MQWGEWRGSLGRAACREALPDFQMPFVYVVRGKPLLLIFINSFRLPKNRGDIIARFSKKVRIFAPRNGLLYHVENAASV